MDDSLKKIPAYPVVIEIGEGIKEVHKGLTKREYFAAIAMQALIVLRVEQTQATKDAVSYADELLNALNDKAYTCSQCGRAYNKHESASERPDLFCCVACEHGY